jgi:hypothetical protein
MAEHDKYDNITQSGDPKKRYICYTLANEGSGPMDWPGEWWSRVYGDYGSGDFTNEWEAWAWLEKEFPGKACAVQEVIWIAEPTKWEERTSAGSKRHHYNFGGLM